MLFGHLLQFLDILPHFRLVALLDLNFGTFLLSAIDAHVLVLHGQISRDGRQCNHLLVVVGTCLLELVSVVHRLGHLVFQSGLKAAPDHDILLNKLHLGLLAVDDGLDLVCINHARM